MATQYSSKAQLIGAGYGGYEGWGETEALADFNATGGSGKMTNPNTGVSIPTSQDGMPDYLQKFQEKALTSLSELKPVEAPTFEELKNNLTPDYAAPTLLNRVAERQALVTSLGVTDLEAE